MKHSTVHLATTSSTLPLGSTAIAPQARCAHRNTWTRAGSRFYRVTRSPELVTCRRCLKQLPVAP